jgi:hypothetical protein
LRKVRDLVDIEDVGAAAKERVDHRREAVPGGQPNKLNQCKRRRHTRHTNGGAGGARTGDELWVFPSPARGKERRIPVGLEG